MKADDELSHLLCFDIVTSPLLRRKLCRNMKKKNHVRYKYVVTVQSK